MTFNPGDIVAEHERLLRSWHDHATSCGRVVNIDLEQGIVEVEFLDCTCWMSTELLDLVW